MVVKLHKVF